MWRECPLRQNDPIYLPLAIQLHDLYIAIAWLGVFILFGQAMVGFVTGIVLLWWLRKFQKNKAPGEVRRYIHWLGIYRIDGAIPTPYLYRIY